MGKIDLIFEKLSNKKFRKYALVMDVGGTVTNIGVAGLDKKPVLVYKSQLWTKHIGSILKITKDSLKFIKDNLKIDIKEAGIAVAGPVDKHTMSVKTTNQNKTVKLSELKNKTSLKKVILLNDFEALGWGINTLTKKDYITINKGKPIKGERIGLIGAGTGLGCTTLIYNEQKKYYVPYPSEGGNSDIMIYDNEELELLKFIKKKSGKTDQEEFVSGIGIQRIYEFLRLKNKFNETKYSKEIDKSKDKIYLLEKYRKLDPTSKEAFKIFSKFYGRITMNFALTHLPYAGIYIAGGIAIRNPDVIGKTFFSELIGKSKKQKIIKGMPVRIITHKELSLIGAAYKLTI